MSIIIKEVKDTDKALKKAFIKFPTKLYEGGYIKPEEKSGV